MANVKISALPAVTTVVPGSDVLPLVSGGITTKATPNAIVQAVLPAPGAIGGTTPSTGSFTNLTYSGTLTGGTGVINIGSGQLYKDASGNVGIGTSSPSTFTGYTTVSVNNATNGGIYNILVNGTETARLQAYSGVFNVAAKGASTALTFETNGSERMRLNSSGNLGLGVTPNASWGTTQTALDFKGNGGVSSYSGGTNSITISQNAYQNGTAWYYKASTAASGISCSQTGTITFLQAAAGTAGGAITWTSAMLLDASGNLGIGTTSPGSKLQVNGTSTFLGSGGASVQWGDTSNLGALSFDGSGNPLIRANTGLPLIFQTNGANERARIDSSGNLLVGTTSANGKFGVESTTNGKVIYGWYTPGSGFTDAIFVSEFRGYAPNNTTARFLYCGDTSAERCTIRSNGGLANFSANNVNLSDERVKTAITPAPSWIAKINAIEVVNFKYKDQTHDDPNLGVIAQQVLSVAPELVDEDGFGETPDDGVPLMAIFETDLKYAMLKAIQELSAELNELKEKVNA